MRQAWRSGEALRGVGRPGDLRRAAEENDVEEEERTQMVCSVDGVEGGGREEERLQGGSERGEGEVARQARWAE